MELLSIVEPKSLATREANYSKFSDRDVREDIHLDPTALYLGLHLAEPINAFAVALCDNIRRIHDVAERRRKNSMWFNAREESISGAEKVSYIIRYSLHRIQQDSHYMKRCDDKYIAVPENRAIRLISNTCKFSKILRNIRNK